MEFRVGDRVVHSIHGVGTVKSIKRQQFAGDKPSPYYEVVTAASTVWVPASLEGAKLRAVASQASLAECRRLLLRDPIPLDKSLKVRQLEISTRLKDTSLAARCALLRDLRARGWAKPLGETEDALLKRISAVVYDEWAASAGVAANAAVVEVENQHTRSRQVWSVGGD